MQSKMTLQKLLTTKMSAKRHRPALQAARMALAFCAMAFASFATAQSNSGSDESAINLTISPELRLDAFPALNAAEDTLRLLDVSHEHTLLPGDLDNGRAPGLDVSASYVWESPRFGQFVLSTNTTYVYNARVADAVSEAVAANKLPDNAALFGKLPELQSSLTFTWQVGNHTATAVASYTDAMQSFGRLSVDQLNIEQLNELVGQITTLDLRYGYNVRAGRQGNASFSVGVRNNFDRRQLLPVSLDRARNIDTPERVAYGTIKYQF